MKNTGGGTIYSPGRRDRAVRMMEQNIASNKANSIRDLNVRNKETALSNQRFAISALPTFMPGTPATPMASPDVFAGRDAVNPVGSYVGQGFQQLANPLMEVGIKGPLLEKLYRAKYGPSDGGVNWNEPSYAMFQYTSPVDYGLS